MNTRTDLEVADILRQYFDTYKKKYNTAPYIENIVRNIISCRTAALGGHVETCEDCGYLRISYNSCRNRHCPKCQFIKKEKWILDKQKDVLPIQYFHVVFTIPDKLNRLMHANRKSLYSLLMKCAGKTITELGREQKFLNAKTGAICVLHTWGQKLDLHPHVHAIVPGGGLSLDKTSWKACRKGYFLPVRVLSKRFRRLFLDGVKKLYRENKLRLEGSLELLQKKYLFRPFVDSLYETDWVVYSKLPFRNVHTVISYLSRYTHRIAISNYRLIKLENDKVFFKYRDYKNGNKQKVLSLHAVEFIRRFLLHILPYRFVRLRYTGMLSNRTREANILLCRTILNVKPEEIPKKQEYSDFAEFLLCEFGFDVKKCPKCNGDLIFRNGIPSTESIRAP